MNSVILGCSFDTAEDQRGFAETYGFQFPLLPDTERSIGMKFGACDSPRDELARRIAYWISTDGTIVESHATVNPKTYPSQQLESIRKHLLKP